MSHWYQLTTGSGEVVIRLVMTAQERADLADKLDFINALLESIDQFPDFSMRDVAEASRALEDVERMLGFRPIEKGADDNER